VWGCDLTDGYIRINADYTTWSVADWPPGPGGPLAARPLRRVAGAPYAAASVTTTSPPRY